MLCLLMKINFWKKSKKWLPQRFLLPMNRDANAAEKPRWKQDGTLKAKTNPLKHKKEEKNLFGLVHIYCGNGKGKTTAATGLAVRAAGFGKKVVFCQFFKNGSSCEIKSLEKLGDITILHCKKSYGLFCNMDEREKESARKDYSELLEKAILEAENADLLVLDEAVSSCNHKIISEERILDFLSKKPKNLEVVLTGRNPSEKLLNAADYVTEMKKIKHPFDKSMPARKGIEF